MISPSDAVADVAPVALNIPSRLVAQEPRGGRDVSRLEFQRMERASQEETAKTPSGNEVSDAESQWKEEISALDTRLRMQAQEMVLRVESERDAAREEARKYWEAELEKRDAEERERALKLYEQFVRERSRYFADVEEEVVKLSLSIAARILHREVMLDPLLLAAVVKVALGKIEHDSTSVLRVPENHLQQWKELFHKGDPAVQIVGDERLAAGECVLDTQVGRVELGIEAQLSEIERGFFDLLRRRPA